MLELDDVHVHYGKVEALKGITVSVKQGEIVTLIGSNGAGKSTTLRTISGLLRPRQGTVTLEGKRLDGLRPHQIVELGAYLRRDANVGSDLERVFELFPRLQEREKQKAGTMSGGEQQMLAIGRALMANPKLLLLDEPSMGIAPILVERIYETIVEINRQGTTILLVEQNANYALGVSKRGYVLETGEIALSDRSEALRDNPEVQRAYLGA